MARKSVFDLAINVDPITALADDLSHITAADIDAGTRGAIDTVVGEAYQRARRGMLDRINLSDAYVQTKMRHEPAQQRGGALVGTIRADGTLTNLGHYRAVQLSKPVRWPNDGVKPGGVNPRKPGARLPWKPRIGDAAKAIPVGMKQSGMSFEVTKGSRKPVSYAFTIGKRSADGNPLVFERTGPGGAKKKGKLRTLTGPSVYQLFRAQMTADFLGSTGAELESTVTLRIVDVIKKRLGI